MATRTKLLSKKQNQALSLIFGKELALKILLENLENVFTPIFSKIEKCNVDLKQLTERLDKRLSVLEDKYLMDNFFKSNGKTPKGLIKNYYGDKK